MKKTLRFSLLLLMIASVVSSCHKSPKQTQYIPKDATFVIGINPESLQEKLAANHLNLDSLFNSFTDTNSVSSYFRIKNWNDIRTSGIDWENNIYVFVNSSGSIMNGQTTSTGVVAVMKNQSDFETFLKKQYSNIDIKKASNYSYAILKDGNAAGWNSDIIILSNANLSTMVPYQTSPNTFNNKDTAAQKQLATLFAQKEDQSVASISQFKDLSTQKADMLFWTNSNSSFATIPFIGMTKAADLFKDSYTAGTINFEDGEAKMQTKSYAGKDLKEILNKYKGSTVNMDMVDKYPSSVNGFSVFSFNPQMLGDIIKYIGFDATANQYFQQMGFTLDDVLKAFKGDFAIVVSDVGTEEKPNEFAPGETTKKPTAKFIFNAAIGDKASYNKIAAALAAKGWMVQRNGQYVPAEMGGSAMSVDDKNLIVASDSILLQQYKLASAGKAAIPSDVAGKAKGSAVDFYVDISSILKAYSANNSPENNIVLDKAKQTFKDVLFTGSNFDGSAVNGTFELRTMNDKENSLATLVKFFSTAAATYKNTNKNLPGMQNMDTIPPANDSLSH
ncbi:MAG: DUF4836 family protein [Chitinophagaceae bacterium]